MRKRSSGGLNRRGLAIKVKHIFPDKPSAYCRVLCFFKKSTEAVILNTKTDQGKDGVFPGMMLQMRIANPSSFARLDAYIAHIRDQILNAGDCRHCSPKCEGKQYVFWYQGKAYEKCQFLCSNFRFREIQDSDVADILAILDGEFAQYAAKRR